MQSAEAAAEFGCDHDTEEIIIVKIRIIQEMMSQFSQLMLGLAKTHNFFVQLGTWITLDSLFYSQPKAAHSVGFSKNFSLRSHCRENRIGIRSISER